MKRTNLTTAVIAGLAGVAGISNMASAVNLSTDGTGSVLIYPYYTVNNNNVTLLSVVNTTPVGKAVKVRFLEAYNSREVLDFNLYLSMFDVWTAEVDVSGSGAGVTTADNSCTVPGFVGSLVPFRNLAYAGVNSDTGPSDLARTREGYVEMIEMGTIVDQPGVSTTPSKKTAEAITHGSNGVPAKCSQVVGAWAPGSGYWTQDSTIDLGTPNGGLFGSGTIVNVGQGTIEGYNADAIEGFYTGASAAQHTGPGSIIPNLATGTSNVAYTFNTTGTGTVSLATTTFTYTVDAVSAVFMTDNVYNEYVVDQAFGESTEWVVTFPTKRFYVDFPSLITKNSLAPAIPPFDVIFGSGYGIGYAGTSCSPVTITPFDREEQTTSSPLDFSPPPTAAGNALCWEANVVTFNQTGDTSTVLGSSRVANVNLPNGFNAGWVDLGFDSATHQLQGTGAGGTNTFHGLPATGFSVQENINTNTTPGVLANYTGLYNHKYNRICTGAAGACS